MPSTLRRPRTRLPRLVPLAVPTLRLAAGRGGGDGGSGSGGDAGAAVQASFTLDGSVGAVDVTNVVVVGVACVFTFGP